MAVDGATCYNLCTFATSTFSELVRTKGLEGPKPVG